MKRLIPIIISVPLLAGVLLWKQGEDVPVPGSFLLSERPTRPNIVLISIDALRGDFFSPEFMPLTYAWAKKHCYIYTNAHSCSTWTKPSHVTMLTGLRQKEHEVEFHEGMIPAVLKMVQEQLKDAGYHTCAFVSGGYVSSEFGFDRGFDEYWQIEWVGDRPLDDDGEAFDRARDYLESVGSSVEPFLMFAHTHMVHQFWTDFVPGCIADEGDEPHQKFQREASLQERRALYAAAVRECDKKLSSFVDFILSNFPNTKIIVTSDHGEGLGEEYAGYVSLNHELLPTPDQTYVPLILYGYGVGLTSQLVGLDDIPGTILQIAGIQRFPKKALSQKRDTLISEHLTVLDLVRHVAVISGGKREITSALDEELAAEQKDRETSSTQEITDELKKQLRALGYVQ